MHLGFYVLFQNHLAIGQNLLDVRAQLTCFRIDDLKLFLYAESENVILLTGSASARRIMKP